MAVSWSPWWLERRERSLSFLKGYEGVRWELPIGQTHPCAWEDHTVTESFESSSPIPLLWTGTPTTRSGCSELRPAWSWMTPLVLSQQTQLNSVSSFLIAPPLDAERPEALKPEQHALNQSWPLDKPHNQILYHTYNTIFIYFAVLTWIYIYLVAIHKDLL